MASIGNELDIGSNKALNLFATIDGQKPSGALKTTDALIEIKAGDEDKKASINVLSGGEINLEAGADMNLKGGSIHLDADSEMNINSGSSMNISSGGSLKIESDGTFEVHSDNFVVDETGMVTVKGQIDADSGEIGGWYVSPDHIGNAKKAADSSVGLANSDTVFWAGDTTRKNAPFQVDAEGNMKASSGTVGGWYIGEEHLGNDPKLADSSVGLYSGANNVDDVVIWAGNKRRENAPFKVKASGKVEVSDIVITGGQISSIEGIGDDQSLKNVNISTSNIQTSVITGTSFSGGSINETEVKRSSIKNGPKQDDVITPVFSVTEDGKVTIRNGEIDIKKFKVTDTGVLTATDADLSGEYHVPCAENSMTNIQVLVSQGALFDQLNPVSYGIDKTRYGLVYEDVADIYPDLTRESDKSITYVDLIAILIKEVQALRTRVAALEGS